MLTILPSTVIFVVKVETSFYRQYRGYCHAIIGGGGLRDIESARTRMIHLIGEELTFLMEVQLIISMTAIVFGNIVLPSLGITGISLEIFTFLVLGYYCVYMLFVVITILLYYDDRKGTLFILILFFVSNAAATYYSIILGKDYYGLGMIASGVFCLIISIIRLKLLIKNIDYRIFCSQPTVEKNKISRFVRSIRILGKEKGDILK
jgi:polysaccharide biosynthesis protein PelG